MKTLTALLLLALAAPAPGVAQHHSDQRSARDGRRLGRLLPLREIERRVVPTVHGAQYLGFEFDAGVYTLKFLREGKVIWVDVDGASGQVLGRTGR